MVINIHSARMLYIQALGRQRVHCQPDRELKREDHWTWAAGSTCVSSGQKSQGVTLISATERVKSVI